MTIHELQAAPIAQPELQSKVATWLTGLSFPAAFELAAVPDGIRIRAEGVTGNAGGFSSLTNQALRWIPSYADASSTLTRPDRAWALKAESDLPTLHHDGVDPFLMWAGRLRDAAQALTDGAEVALRIVVLREDPDLQRKLRALSAYSYGSRIEEDEPHLWALRLKLWRGLMGVGGAGTALSGGATAAGWIPTPAGALLLLAGSTVFVTGMVGWQRWLRTRNIPREVLEHYAAGPLLRAALLLTMRGVPVPRSQRGDGSRNHGKQVLDQFFSSGLPFSGPVSKVELDPSLLAADRAPTALDSYALAVPGNDLAGLLTPAEDGDPSTLLHPGTRMDVPSPEATPALRRARFRIGRAVAGGNPIGVDPDGHGLIVGGSRSGKSSLAYALLKRLFDDDDPPGLFLLDPHLSLADSFLSAIDELPPDERAEAVERLLIITPDQPEIVPLNLLAVPDFTWAGNALIQVGSRIWDDYWGPRMQAALLALFRLAQAWNMKVAPQERLSLFHLVFAAFQDKWREKAMAALPPEGRMGSLALNALLGQFAESASTWQQGWTTEVVSPIISKVMALELSPWLFQAMHQPHFMDLEGVIEDRRWIIMRVPTGTLGNEGSRMLAAVVYNVWEAAFRRVATPEDPIPYLTIVDEAQHIASGMRLETLLAEGAKFGARLFVLTQSMTMMRNVEDFEAVVQALLANTSTQAFFSPDPEDAELIRDILSSRLRYGDMTLDLPSLTCWLRARIDGRWQPPTLMECDPLAFAPSGRVNDLIREVIEAHPEEYTRPEMGVQASLNALKRMVPGKAHRLGELYFDLDLSGNDTIKPSGMNADDQTDSGDDDDGAAGARPLDDDDGGSSWRSPSVGKSEARLERLGLKK